MEAPNRSTDSGRESDADTSPSANEWAYNQWFRITTTKQQTSFKSTLSRVWCEADNFHPIVAATGSTGVRWIFVYTVATTLQMQIIKTERGTG